MADQDETMKIVIEVVDKFSKPLADLKKSLNDIGDKGGEGTSKMKRNFDALREAALSVGNALHVTVVPALRALGLGFGGVAAAVTGVVASIRGLAGSTETLARLSRETGFAVEKMRNFQYAGERVGITAESMAQSFRNFYDATDKARVGLGNLNDLRNRFRDPREFDRILAIPDINKRLEAIMEYGDRLRGPSAGRHRRELYGAVGMNPNLADLEPEERKRLMKEAEQLGDVSKKQIEESKRFGDELQRISLEFEKMRKALVDGGILSDITAGLSGLASALGRWKALSKDETRPPDFEHETFDRMRRPEVWQGIDAKEQLQRTKPGWFTSGGKPVPLAGTVDELRKSLGGSLTKDEQKDTIKEGTEEGVVKGFQRKMLEGGGVGGGGDGGGSFGGARVIRASLGGGGGGSAGGYSGGYGGGGGVRSPGTSGGAVESAEPMGGLRSLAQDRERFAKELEAKPWLREKILGIAAGENKNPRANLAVIESMMNRASARGTSLEQAARRYGHEAGGYYAGYDPAGARSPRHRGMIEGNLAKALGGSNVSDYATDNASSWLAAKNKRTGRFRLQYEQGGESFFSPGTAGGAHGPASRERYERWRKGLDENERKSNQGTPPPAVPRERLLEQNSMINQRQRIEGNATVRIDLNGFPRGSKFAAASSGVFSEVEMHRGSTLPLASESA